MFRVLSLMGGPGGRSGAYIPGAVQRGRGAGRAWRSPGAAVRFRNAVGGKGPVLAERSASALSGAYIHGAVQRGGWRGPCVTVSGATFHLFNSGANFQLSHPLGASSHSVGFLVSFREFLVDMQVNAIGSRPSIAFSYALLPRC